MNQKPLPIVQVHPLDQLGQYQYSVIFARYQGKWLYSRHKERDTWETAGGHIEPGESTIEAAKRELYEETGAVDFEICPAFDYSVRRGEESSNGQVFFADIKVLAPLPESEMGEIRLFDSIPEGMTYPHIQPMLFEQLTKVPNIRRDP